jgi:hypothetical protein
MSMPMTTTHRPHSHSWWMTGSGTPSTARRRASSSITSAASLGFGRLFGCAESSGSVVICITLRLPGSGGPPPRPTPWSAPASGTSPPTRGCGRSPPCVCSRGTDSGRIRGVRGSGVLPRPGCASIPSPEGGEGLLGLLFPGCCHVVTPRSSVLCRSTEIVPEQDWECAVRSSTATLDLVTEHRHSAEIGC